MNTKTPTIKDLRQNNYKVRVEYSRFTQPSDKLLTMKYLRDNNMQRFINARGGRVLVQLTTPDGENFEGVSFCNKSDVFVKKYGLVKALGRAISKMKRTE